MKKLLLALLASLTASHLFAESLLKPINDRGYGSFTGRIQSLSMYRDFDARGNGANSSLGLVLGYTTPDLAGLDAGVAYNGAWEVYENNNTAILANDDISILNEAWIRLRMEALNAPETTAVLGRRIYHREVFRKDDFRQKARSIESFHLESGDLSGINLVLGHAYRLSNWIQAGDKAEFNNFGDVFGVDYDTDGLTWGEVHLTGIEKWDIALFDAYAWDVANLVGAHTQWQMADETALMLYLRHEGDVGRAEPQNSEVYGVSIQQQTGPVKLEPGYFGVHGSDLRFQETTTGINHPLGAQMIICSCPFKGDSDTVFVKAVSKVGTTTLYGLYNYTWHAHDGVDVDGQEINFVVKQPLADNLALALKGGYGYHDWKGGKDDTDSLDARLFVTYTY